jgi:hypothetical protein
MSSAGDFDFDHATGRRQGFKRIRPGVLFGGFAPELVGGEHAAVRHAAPLF